LHKGVGASSLAGLAGDPHPVPPIKLLPYAGEADGRLYRGDFVLSSCYLWDFNSVARQTAFGIKNVSTKSQNMEVGKTFS